MKMEKKRWMPRVRACVWLGPKIYERPRGVALWATATTTHHHYLRPRVCVAGCGKQAEAVKNGSETAPSGAWPDAEGDINQRKRQGPLAFLNGMINETN